MGNTKLTEIISKIDAICKVYNISEWGLSENYILYIDNEYLAFKEILQQNLKYHILDKNIEIIFCDIKNQEKRLWKPGPSGNHGREGYKPPSIY